MTTPLSQREQLQVAQLRAQLANADAAKATELVSSLDPAGTLKKRITDANAEANRFIEEKTQQFTSEKRVIEDTLRLIEMSEKTAYPLERHRKNLEEKKKKYAKENADLEHTIRANRRRFLDNEPQAGTFSLFGLRTSDDKVLLGFWFMLVLSVSVATFAFLTINQKPQDYRVYLGVNFTAFVAAYLFIYYRS